MPKDRLVLFVMDGVGDLGITPLECAKKPNLDKLAKDGILGMFSPLGRGVVPGSGTSHLQLFGYPFEYYPGRGVLEALGAGVELKKGDVAFRINFATIKNNMIVDRRAGRISTDEAKLLEKILNMKIGNCQFIFKSTVEHRGALVLRGKNISSHIADTDPHSPGKVVEPQALDKRASSTAALLSTYLKKVNMALESHVINKKRKKEGLHQANFILLRGASSPRSVPNIKERFGINGCCVAGGALYKGVARYVGMNVLNVMGATGDKYTNLINKGKAVLRSLEDHHFVFLHTKATDSFSHDGDFEGKKKFIERIDRELVPYLIKSGANIIITGDHSTPVSFGRHTGHEVPILIYGNERIDDTTSFCEREAMKGGLGHIEGKDLMGMVLNLIGKGKIVGS